jgi:hypothetical protein
MLTNSEFAVVSGIDAPLSGEMAEFAMFTIDLGDVMTPIGRDANGKRVLKPANPSLVGKGKNLWEVTPLRDTATPAEMRKATEVERILREKGAKTEREANIARYAALVEAGAADTEEGLFGVQEEETPLDGWDKFFADDVPMTGGRCRRRGGVKDHASFEGFIDSAE